MTPLRQRMLHELERRNYAPSTIRGYLNVVSRFAEYFHRSPERLGPEHLRRYQRYLLQERKLAPSTFCASPDKDFLRANRENAFTLQCVASAA